MSSQDKATVARRVILHRHMQRRFDKHRDAIERHKQKGGAFARAVEDLEKRLFGVTDDRSLVDGDKTST